MKKLRLVSAFVAAPEDAVRYSLQGLSASEPMPVVPGAAPEAKQKVDEGAIGVIPAQGGCVLVTTDAKSLAQATGALAALEARA